MGKYFGRVLRYMIKMVVLMSVLLGILAAMGMLRVSGSGLLAEFFFSWRGWFIMGLLVALSLTYPRFGYLRTELRADMDTDREHIVNAFTSIGYELTEESGDRMTFAARSVIKKVLSVWDDTITVEKERHGISVEGIRKEVARVDYRIRLYSGK